MPLQYPFSAVLGCDITDRQGPPTPLGDLGLSLVLTAISPAIGGVLVRGEKGTAKSTAVRALAQVLPDVRVHSGDRFSIDPDEHSATSPDGPFAADTVVERPVRLVELPVGAAEERVVGSLDLAQALERGSVAFEPGLLARAHRGVLYVDEVNLLGDHVVDVLLDAAATGRVTVERDAFSLTHAARFVLVGTMNPEEGELRPQLLDRFGLTVEVAAPRDPRARVEVVQRRLAFDADPGAFGDLWEPAQQQLRDRILRARAALATVRISDAAFLKIAEICAAFEVDGMRADIVTTRTALAHAAWAGRGQVTRADIRAAALLALPHRRRRNPFDAPGLDEELLDRLLGEGPDPDLDPDPDTDPDTDQGDGNGDGDGGPDGPNDTPGMDADADADVDGASPAGGIDDGAPEPTPDASADRERAAQPPAAPRASPPSAPVAAAGDPYRPRLFTVAGTGTAGGSSPGNRSKAYGPRGSTVGARHGAHGPLHLAATLRAAAERRALTGVPAVGRGAGPDLRPEDLRTAIRRGGEANLLVFCVDASGSMAARQRMAPVKTAILSLLGDAYRRRDKVALITFGRGGAHLVLPPTHSIEVAAQRLADLATGGRTPLAEALLSVDSLLLREKLRHPELRPLVLLVTDGRATHGEHPVERSRAAADHVARRRVPVVVLDSESGPMRLGLARTLAQHLGAEHLPVAHLDATVLTDTVKGHVA